MCGVDDPDTRSGSVDRNSPPSDSHPFDALVASTNFSDLTRVPDNAEILQGLKENDPDFDETWCGDYDVGAEENILMPENELLLVWWGYLIGKNTTLKTLGIHGNITERFTDLTEDEVELFFKGLCQNESIEYLYLEGNWDFYHLRPFFANNPNLKFLQLACSLVGMAGLVTEAKALEDIEIFREHTNDEIMGELLRAIGSLPRMRRLELHCEGYTREGNTCMEALAASLQHPTSSLRRLELIEGFDDEGLETLATALLHSGALDWLQLSWNYVMTSRGWQALSELLQSGKCSLHCLSLRGPGLNDEGMEILVPGLHISAKLRDLHLTGSSLTSTGWQTLLSLLQNPNLNLEGLGLGSVNFDDEMALLFARALSTNNTVRRLNLNSHDLSVAGWAAMSQLLCDTSSINKTFLSNHTLQSLNTTDYPKQVLYLLNLNHDPDKTYVATEKILESHPNFDLAPLCKWGFKMLPLLADWFERAARSVEDPWGELERRKLSEIFKFVRCASVALATHGR